MVSTFGLGRAGLRQRFGPTEGLACLAGVMATTALPPFAHTGWLMPIVLALLFALLDVSPRPGAVAGWFGLAHQATLLYWLFLIGPEAAISAHGLVPAAAVLAILYAAAFYLLFGWVFGLVRGRLGRARSLLLAPPLWTGMEALRGMGEMGFPWCLSGAAWIATPLRPLAAASGEIGLGAATAFSGLALLAAVKLLRARQVRAAASAPAVDEPPGLGWGLAAIVPAVCLWVAIVAGAAWRGPVRPVVPGGPARAAAPAGAVSDAKAFAGHAPLRIAAVQADVALRDKWDEGKIDSTRIPYTRLTMRAGREGAELVVWAETAVPDYLILVPDLLDWIRHLAIDAHVNLFLGYPHARMLPGHEQPLRFNGAGLFGPDGRLKDYYAKAHLLPFGENMPFSSVLPFLSKIDLGQAEWTPGAPPAPILVETGHGEYSIACLICFEAILPGLSRGAVRRGAEYLVNITNDGWFGATAGPRQHAELARMRAAECGVPMVRCANNGISYITDDRGGFLRWAGLHQRALVMDDVAPGRGATLFVRVGAWPLAILLLLWTAGVILAPRLLTSARRSP